MLLEIKGLLNGSEVARLQELGRTLRFVDGRASNPGNVTKRNEQADPNDAHYGESVQLVNVALSRSREFRDFALPKRIAPPLLCRYEKGMTYGAHADAALLMMPSGVMRSDVSCTVFINDPKTYTGGELVIEIGTRTLAFKGAAGDAIVYPSTTMHQVVPVTAGIRLVSITFIESMVPDAQARQIIYDLNEISALEGNSMKFENRMRLELARANLLRMWA